MAMSIDSQTVTIDSQTAAPLTGAPSFHAWPPRVTARGVLTRAPSSPRFVEAAEDEASEVLPGWDHADAFEGRWPSARAADAMTMARALLRPARTAKRVLAVRHLLVAPFGVRPAHQGDVLLFPIQAAGPDQVACGLADSLPYLMRRQHRTQTTEAGKP